MLLGAPTPRLEPVLAPCLPPRAFPRRAWIRGLLLGDAVITGWRYPESSTDAGPGPSRGVGSASTGASVSEDTGVCPAPLRRCMITATAMVHTTPTAPQVPTTAIHLCNHHNWEWYSQVGWEPPWEVGRGSSQWGTVAQSGQTYVRGAGDTVSRRAFQVSLEVTQESGKLCVPCVRPPPSFSNQYAPRLATVIDGAILCA